MKKRISSLALVASLIAAPAVMAEQIPFYKSWKEQKVLAVFQEQIQLQGRHA